MGLKEMHKEKKFKELVFYLEACESGSMFHDLPTDINVYAITSANATQASSYCYWDHDIRNFLGDVFSVKWLEDSDREDLNKETLEKQYEIVKKETAITSNVIKFGDIDISKSHVADFMGTKEETSSLPDNSLLSMKYHWRPLTENQYRYYPPTDYTCDKSPGMLDPRDVELEIMWRSFKSAKTSDLADQLYKEIVQHISVRTEIEDKFKAIAKRVLIDEAKVQWSLTTRLVKKTAQDCYYETIDEFTTKCKIGRHPYALKWFFVLSNLCEKATNKGKNIVIKAIDNECGSVHTDQFVTIDVVY